MEPEDEAKITLELNVPQKGSIKVSSQIINDLSSGIYSSPASCVKELVNNSYDAEAANVVIRIKPIEDNIIVIDDGVGMNAEDFENNFAWISKSNKRNDGELSPNKKRPLIGKIGIGFIAVNEICEVLEITSSKKGESIKFTATIKFSGDTINKEVNDGIIKAAYDLINEEEDINEHYTVIRLAGLRDSVRTILDDQLYYSELNRSKSKGFDKDSFDSMLDLIQYHKSRNLKSFANDNAYVQFIIDLASYIPVEYIEGGPVVDANDSIIKEIVEYHKKLDFKVDLDGIYLKKPVYFEKDYKARVYSFKEKITLENNKTLEFKGYFYIQHGLLVPRELNGIAIRIKSIPIADQFGYDPTFLRYPNYMDQLVRNWVSGEIYMSKGLEDAMNIDRKSFRVTHPDYLAIQNYLHHILRNNVFKIALELYDNARDTRDENEKEVQLKDQKEILGTKSIEIKHTDRIVSKDRNDVGEIKYFPVSVLKNSSEKTIIELDQAMVKQYKKKDWELLENVFIIFELAVSESNGDIKKLRELFYSKINTWKKIK